MLQFPYSKYFYKPVNITTFSKSIVKQFYTKNPTFTLLQLVVKQQIKNIKTKHYEQYIQRITGRLRCKQIRKWLFRHYHRFCGHLVAVGSMQLKN
jgi:hypothetical protein